MERAHSVRLLSWAPVAILTLGIGFTAGIGAQRSMDLRAPLDVTIPSEINGQKAIDVQVPKAEQRVAGMTSYVMRVFSPTGSQQDQVAASFSVYVGYYASQIRGRTIHSPKNCLPGAGWEALTSSQVAINTSNGPVKVNRYVLQRGEEKALVLYWYQGRGRVESNEYRVKLNLLRDAAFKNRSDEALVRIVVPAKTTVGAAFEQAADVAKVLMPAVTQALPAATD
jgi:EpsI family protein